MKFVALALLLVCHASTADSPGSGTGSGTADALPDWLHAKTAPGATESCFLLFEVGVGEVRRRPSDICGTRLLPASTFKIPHALAALDAGVLAGPDAKFVYDGSPQSNASWRRDHTLASAMRYSVVWYFQRVAEKLGADRERQYLKKFNYGNADSSSGLTTFWLGGSLQITAEEQLLFMRRLYNDDLPVSRAAMRTVRQLLVQPQGLVVNAAGEHPFAAPWPAGTTVSAKTGSGTDRGGKTVRWLVGHVARGPRSWLFVSSVSGGSDIPALAAVDQAASALREEGVLR
jgi:beta-lactamase class D